MAFREIYTYKYVIMRIEHIALWCVDIEYIKDFYVKYFGVTAGERYHNPVNRFTSYFLAFPNGGAKLEIMNREDIADLIPANTFLGYAHIAISVSGKHTVDVLTDKIRRGGFRIVGEPRITGDGYYESVIEDPEGNLIEIVADFSC